MPKIQTLPAFTSAPNSSQMNDAFTKITTAMSNTLSRDGSTPNAMAADLDLNGNDVLNVNILDVTTLTMNGERVTTLTPDYGHFYAKTFGAIEDYDQATGLGTDDTVAIQAALDYAGSEWAPGMTGGVVWVHKRSLISAPLSIPRGVRLDAVIPRASVGQGQTGDSVFPITFNEGSGLVGRHLTGPMIRIQYNDSSVGSLTLGATSARSAAAIGSGLTLWNGGILVSPADTASANMQRVILDQVLVRDQPADGIAVCGDVVYFVDNESHVHNCGRHGIVIDNGLTVGRTFTGIPGLFTLNSTRANNLGGHIILIGHPDAGSDQPYRGILNNCEGFRLGNNATTLVASAGMVFIGKQLIITACAPSGTGGYTGSVPTLDYSCYVSGQNIHLVGCRYINFALQAGEIGSVSGLGSEDIQINGTVSTTATDPDYAFNVTGVVRGLLINGLVGDFVLGPVDVPAIKAISSSGWGYYWWGSALGGHESDSWNMSETLNNLTITGFFNIGTRVLKTIASGEITVASSRISVGTEGGAASDDLRVINGGSDGDMLFLSTASASNDVVLKQRVSGTDNLLLAGSADVILDHSQDSIFLVYRGTDERWVQTAFSNNA